MFNQQELQILLGGVNSPIDVADLRAHTQYGGLYDDHHATIEMFWRVVESLTQDQRRALLRFATSCSRPPLLYVLMSFRTTIMCLRETRYHVGASRNWCRTSRYETQARTRTDSQPLARV